MPDDQASALQTQKIIFFGDSCFLGESPTKNQGKKKPAIFPKQQRAGQWIPGLNCAGVIKLEAGPPEKVRRMSSPRGL